MLTPTSNAPTTAAELLTYVMAQTSASVIEEIAEGRFKMEAGMKKLLIAAAALAFLASPLSAQSQGANTNGSKPIANKEAPKGVNTKNDVYCNGQYVGSDPDPAIRLQLLKDFNTKDCGGE
jgi:hypothetical protein